MGKIKGFFNNTGVKLAILTGPLKGFLLCLGILATRKRVPRMGVIRPYAFRLDSIRKRGKLPYNPESEKSQGRPCLLFETAQKNVSVNTNRLSVERFCMMEYNCGEKNK